MIASLLLCYVNSLWSAGPFEESIEGRNYSFYGLNENLVHEITKQVIEYNISKVVFRPGDVVVDVGANIGIFSILLAKKFPFLKIFSFEPEEDNFRHLEMNIKLNNISEKVIFAVNKALNKDGSDVILNVPRGAPNIPTIVNNEDTKWYKKSRTQKVSVKGISLPQVFKEFNISKCKLLKIDCEGCEYETLYHAGEQTLRNIEVFRGEFHDYDSLISEGFTSAKLQKDMSAIFTDFEVTYFSLSEIERDRRARKIERDRRAKKRTRVNQRSEEV